MKRPALTESEQLFADAMRWRALRRRLQSFAAHDGPYGSAFWRAPVLAGAMTPEAVVDHWIAEDLHSAEGRVKRSMAQ